MPIQDYPNGVGGTLGDQLATGRPLRASGNVWYVHSSTGSDAASPAGLQRERPLATLAQALTNCAAGDIIVCLSGHTQVLNAEMAFSKAGVSLVGEGLSSGVPTVTFSHIQPVVPMFNISAAGVKIRGIKIATGGVSLGNHPRVTWSGASGEIRGCYFEAGVSDQRPSVRLTTGANNFLAKSCTFVSVTADASVRPGSGLEALNAVSDLDIFDCIFDGGSYGFAGSTGAYVALDLSAAITTRLRAEALSLLRGADYAINASTTGYVNVQTATGGSRGTW
jgi:hypothetical protein